MKVRREYSVAIFSFFRNCFPNCRGKIIIWPKKKKKKIHFGTFGVWTLILVW
jgi:hypothetical protein